MTKETGVRCSTKQTRNKRIVCRHDIIISPGWIFGCDAGASIALVEISGTGHIFPILHKRSVIGAAWSIRPGAGLEPVTGAQFLDRAVWIRRIAVAKLRINWKSISGIANQHHLGSLLELSHESGWNAVIVIGSARLDVGVVMIHPQLDLAGKGFVLPA